MRAAAYFLPGLMLSMLAAAMLYSGAARPADPARPAETFDLISGFQCHAAETRHVFFAGHDGVDVAVAPSETRALVQFSPPALLAEGFVLVAAGPEADGRDIGLRLSHGAETPARTVPATGWRAEGGFLHARLSALHLDAPPPATEASETRSPVRAPPGSLLDHARRGGGELTVDVFAAAPLAASQVTVILCEEPPPGMGLAMRSVLREDIDAGEITLMGCHYEDGDAPQCDPLRGNARCDARLPLLCFHDLDAAAPDSASLAYRRAHQYEFYWSGGRIAATGDVQGDAFATVQDAHRLCESEFGPGWRVANYHEGSRSNNFAAYGGLAEPWRFHWLDIKDQPYATCWRR